MSIVNNHSKELNILSNVSTIRSSSDTRTIRNIRDIVALVQKEGAGAAVLSVAEVQAGLLSFVADRSCPYAQRLQALKLYGDTIGAFGGASGGGGRRVRVRFADTEPVDAEVVSENVSQ